MRLAFPPAGLGGSFDMVEIWRVFEAVASDIEAAGKSEGEAAGDADRQLMSALLDGRLRAYLNVAGDPGYFVVPPQYWSEPDANISLAGKPFAYPLDGSVPQKFIDQLVYMERGQVDTWRHEHFAPARKRGGGRSAIYPWPAFEVRAVERLDEEGAFNEAWQQADLEREMADWCLNNWEKIPSESLIRTHVKRAESAFLKMRADI